MIVTVAYFREVTLERASCSINSTAGIAFIYLPIENHPLSGKGRRKGGREGVEEGGGRKGQKKRKQ